MLLLAVTNVTKSLLSEWAKNMTFQGLSVRTGHLKIQEKHRSDVHDILKEVTKTGINSSEYKYGV